jgi:hypothetical protein
MWLSKKAQRSYSAGLLDAVKIVTMLQCYRHSKKQRGGDTTQNIIAKKSVNRFSLLQGWWGQFHLISLVTTVRAVRITPQARIMKALCLKVMHITSFSLWLICAVRFGTRCTIVALTHNSISVRSAYPALASFTLTVKPPQSFPSSAFMAA